MNESGLSGFEKVMYRHDSQVTPMSLFAVNDWEWFYKSEGIFFWPQLLLATFSLVHVLACFYLLSGRYYLGNGLLSPGRLMGGIQRHARLDRSERKKEAEKAPANLLEYVISSGLKREKSLGNSESDRIEVEAGLQDAIESVYIGTERRLGYLGLFAQINMLVGLLGTVVGMVASFQVISQSNTAPPPRELASGVSQALLTTIVGLGVAIPSLCAYFHFRGKSLRLQLDLEQAASQFLSENFPKTVSGKG